MDVISQQQLHAAIASPEAFDAILNIDADGEVKRMAVAMDDWQREDRAVINPGLRSTVGQAVDAPYQRFWLERGRGHSKTTDIAVCAAYMLFASRRKIEGVACAADRDQALLIRNAIDMLCRLNPWLADVLDVQAFRIVNRITGSVLTILAADVASSWGLLIDFAICDEITVWPKRDLFDSILSAVAKRKRALLLVIANAGYRTHCSFELREAIRQDKAWYFRRLDGPVASWHGKEHLDEQRRLLPARVFARVWLNEWQDADDNALDPKLIHESVTLRDPQPPRRNRIYIAGLDLGISNDHSALCVLSVDPMAKRVALANCVAWKPEDFEGGKVDLDHVEREVEFAANYYDLAGIGADPWQCEHMIQRLANRGVRIGDVPFTPQNKDLMARALLEGFNNTLIDLYDDKQLIRDLQWLRIREGPLGYRLEAPRDENGHCDKATAFCIALPNALKLAREGGFAPEPQDEVLMLL